MRLRSRLAVLLIGPCLANPSTPAHAEGLRYDWRLEDGLEHDTNPARAERIEGVHAAAAPASALARVVGAGNLAIPIGERDLLTTSAALGGKWFLSREASAENVIVVQAAARNAVRVLDRTLVSTDLAYYDVFQRRSLDLPDFRSLTPALRIDQGLGPLLGSLGAGYRWFRFKPDARYSFQAPTAFLSVRHSIPGDLEEGGADWEWSAGTSVELRSFEGPACSAQGCTDEKAARHDDQFWISHAEVSRTSRWLCGAGAALHLNRSNSYGESLARGLFHLRAVVPLPAELSLSARAEIVLTRYADRVSFLQPVAGLPSATIEDESRSTLRVELSRLIEGRFELGARYVFYTSAPASGDVSYRRQTLLLYLAFVDER